MCVTHASVVVGLTSLLAGVPPMVAFADRGVGTASVTKLTRRRRGGGDDDDAVDCWTIESLAGTDHLDKPGASDEQAAAAGAAADDLLDSTKGHNVYSPAQSANWRELVSGDPKFDAFRHSFLQARSQTP